MLNAGQAILIKNYKIKNAPNESKKQQFIIDEANGDVSDIHLECTVD